VRIRDAPPLHLTYCTNIHRGESFPEVRANVLGHVAAVKARVSPDARFGVGLRLGAAAAEALADAGTVAAFAAELRACGLYVFTVNGFPYGPFHGVPVKERVYLPDWLDDARLAYADRLAAILAALLPAEDALDRALEGSVSTVPGCYADRGHPAAVAPEIAARLRRHALALVRLRARTGRTVTLALEPEPGCLLETTADAVLFFEQHLLAPAGVAAFAALAGMGRGEAEETLRLHLGVCLDACHAAVEFEDPAQALAALDGAGVRLLKVQVSAGLRASPAAPGALAALGRFAEEVYLHQTVIRRGGELVRVADLPEALARSAAGTLGGGDAGGEEWRVHFHVPIFQAALPPFESTQAFTAELLGLLGRGAAAGAGAAARCPHLEVETYTWDVLPPEHRRDPVDVAVARELTWAAGELARAAGATVGATKGPGA
jgi:sugar phosphate isomerase/epimerase